MYGAEAFLITWSVFIFQLLYGLELSQETDIILRIQAQVVDLITDLCDPLYAHAECEAGIHFRVYAEITQHVGVHHAATEYLYPAGMFAQAATAAPAYGTGNVHFGTGFCKGEIRRAETDFCFRAEHFGHKMVQCLFEIGKGNAFIDV